MGFFEQAYRGRPAWDIPGPQPAVARLVELGLLRGPVLDVGCGTGENALHLARCGLRVTGVERVRAAFGTAVLKAQRLDGTSRAHLRLVQADALRWTGRGYRTVLDSGTFHGLTDAQRRAYARRAARLLAPDGCLYLLGFRAAPHAGGPMLEPGQVRAAFSDGWDVAAAPTVMALHRDGSPWVVPAWLFRVRRAVHPARRRGKRRLKPGTASASPGSGPRPLRRRHHAPLASRPPVVGRGARAAAFRPARGSRPRARGRAPRA